MSDDDLYLQALQNFLKSDEWNESLFIFIRANCLYFDNVQDFHAQQHVLWKSFQEIAENVIQMGLMTVGGSIEQLEHALDDLYSRPSRGPRDEVIKDIIQSLHAVEDFHQFARMMNKHCREVIEERGGFDDDMGNPYDMLMRMGFIVDHINSAYERLGKTSTLEEVIGYLSARAAEVEEEESKREFERKQHLSMKRQQRLQQQQSSTSGKTGPTPSSSASRPARQARTPPKRVNNYAYYQEQDANVSSKEPMESPRVSQEPSPQGKKKRKKNRSSGGGGSTEGLSMRPLTKFIEEAAADGLDIDINELNVKFSTADSVLESYHELQKLSNGSTIDEKLLDLAKWGADMKQLQADIYEAYESNVSSRDMCFNHSHGLIVWYQELEQQRQELNERSNGLTGDMLSDSEMKRMAELDKIAAEGSEDERHLHSLLSRHEQVRKEIQNYYRKISIVISTYNLRRPLVEETYLFLKEQVGSNRSLEDIFAATSSSSAAGSSSSASVIEKVVSAPGGIEVMNLFLELQGLEEEQQFLKVEINTLLGIPIDSNTSSSGATNGASSAAAAGENGDNGDGIQLDDIFAASAHVTAEDKRSYAAGEDVTTDAKHSNDTLSAVADAKSSTGVHSSDAKGLDVKHTDSDSKQEPSASSPMTMNKNASMSNIVVANPDNDLISGLKQTHRDALDKLKAALEADKLKKLHDLENRLLLRKKKLQQRKANSDGSEGKDDGLSIEEEEGVIQLLEEEINGVEQQYQLKQQCLLDGLKHHCINELKAARQILEENPHVAKKETVFSQLIQSKQDDIDSNAVNALKEKYEHDKNQLLDYYANERQRQRAKMLKALEKRKGNGHSSTPEAIEKELAAIDEKIDREMHNNLSNLREQLLLGLGGVNVMNEVTADNQVFQRKKQQKRDDYDDYLNDTADNDIETTRKNNKKTLDYVDQLDSMKKMYVEAGQKLQKDLFAKKYSKGKKRVISTDGNGNASNVFDEQAMDAERLEYEQLVNVVDNMVLDAYQTHVMDLSAGLKDGDDSSSSLPLSLKKNTLPDSASNVSQKEMEERMKAGMLEAFEKAKSQLAETQENQRKRTQDKLAARRKQRGKNEGKDDIDDDNAGGSISETLLEEVIDSFLQPPGTSASAANDRNNTNTTDQRANAVAGLIAATTQVAQDNVIARAPSKDNHVATSKVDDSKTLEQEKTKILSSHNEKEKALVDDLYATMMDKKKKLEDRIKRKREKQQQSQESHNPFDADEKASSDMQTSSAAHEEEEIRKEQEKIQALEQAFQKVTQSLQHLNPSSLNNMSVDQLVAMMEKLMNGNSNADSAVTASHNADSRGHSRPISAHQQKEEDKESIAREAARISTAYAEEQQKLDLMMKIQQARQRQALQKKLWERNQARLQQQQQEQQQGRFGLTPLGNPPSGSNHQMEEEDEDDDDDDDQPSGGHGKIQIGGYKSRLTEMQPFRQPTIRGLGNVPAVLEPRAPLTQQKSLQSRGLNLAPMMRR